MRNPRCLAWLALRTRADRALRGAFLLDGERLAREAVNSGKARALLIDEKRSDRFQPLIYEAVKARVEVCYLPSALMERLSDTPSPQGVIVEAQTPEEARADQLGSRVVVLDGVQDPGNVGTIVRTADAAGVTGILTSERTADPYSMKAARASMGSVFRVKVCVKGDVEGIVGGWKKEGVKVVAADARGEMFSGVRIDEPWALLIGSEGKGVSEGLRAMADKVASIPMRAEVESLNAAVAASILIYALRY
jgi:TrmH family RNA methyltransferase